jgi:hypothetical protein
MAPHHCSNPPLPPPTILDPALACPKDPIDQAEMAVVAALDDLTARGILHTRNRMDLENLLNPIEESLDIEETLEEDIFEAVMEC